MPPIHANVLTETGVFTEKQVVRLWQQAVIGRPEMVTEDGEWLRVIYPGRLNDGRGADFCDAVILNRGGYIKGDIEVHVNASGWQAHRHHLDPAYNGTALHVVMWPGSDTATTRQDGCLIPLVALSRQTKSSDCIEENGRQDLFPCQKNHGQPEAVAGALDTAGDERFQAKTAELRSHLVTTEEGQVLYTGLMGALGYAKNKTPFRELARRVPLTHLQTILQEKETDEARLAGMQAMLFGKAGLLPSQSQSGRAPPQNDITVNELERIWAALGEGNAMPVNAWYNFKVRPNNSPFRRIAAMSYLLVRYPDPLNAMLNAVEENEPDELEAGLTVNIHSYWADHADFFTAIAENPTLLGRSRAADMVVNVLLPFALAIGEASARPTLAEKALALFHDYPPLAANSIEKHMRRQFGLAGTLSARRQQGLIHIYRLYCTQGKCGACPLSKL